MNECITHLIPLLLLCPLFEHPHDVDLTLIIYFCTSVCTGTGPSYYSTWGAFLYRWCTAVILKPWVHQNHLDSVLKTGMTGLHPQSFWFGESEVGSESLHFQVHRRCWDYTWRTGLWNVISCPTAEHIPFASNLIPISYTKPYFHSPPHLISPKTAHGHNILFPQAFPFSWDFILME